jgi:hypothetical protein
MEAELTALDTASVEAEWLRELLIDLPVDYGSKTCAGYFYEL